MLLPPLNPRLVAKSGVAALRRASSGKALLTPRTAPICMAHTYQYPRPAVTVDTIIVSKPQEGHGAQLLLIKRKNPPFKDCWALPGGFVDEGEGLDAAAGRELQEETSVDPSSVALTQVGAFGDPGRDPRGWTITVAYAALVPSTHLGVKAADDAKDARWWEVSALPPLAFDHKLVVRTALRHLAGQQPAQAVAADKLEGPWLQPDPSQPAGGAHGHGH